MNLKTTEREGRLVRLWGRGREVKQPNDDDDCWNRGKSLGFRFIGSIAVAPSSHEHDEPHRHRTREKFQSQFLLITDLPDFAASPASG